MLNKTDTKLLYDCLDEAAANYGDFDGWEEVALAAEIKRYDHRLHYLNSIDMYSVIIAYQEDHYG